MSADHLYSRSGKRNWKFDIYRPPASLAPPVLVLVAPDPGEGSQEEGRKRPVLAAWADQAAAAGFAAIVFDHRPIQEWKTVHDAAGDLDDLLKHLRENAADLGLDPERVALLAFGDAAPYGLRPALAAKPSVRAAAAVDPLLDLRPRRDAIPARVLDATLEEFSPLALAGRRGPGTPPILVVKSGSHLRELDAAAAALSETARARGLDVQILGGERMPEGTGHAPAPLPDASARVLLEFLLETTARP